MLVHFLASAGNGFHTTGHINVAFVGNDALRSGGNGLQAGRAETVDGHARHVDGAASTQGDLAGDVGAGSAFGGGTAHDDVVHFTGFDAGALDGVLHGVAAEGGAVGHVEGTFPALGQRGTGGRNNNCGCHGDSLILEA